MSTHLEGNTCPSCGTLVDQATYIEDESSRPKKGDISICAYCGSLATFDENLRLKEITRELFNSLKPEEKLDILKLKMRVAQAFKHKDENETN